MHASITISDVDRGDGERGHREIIGTVTVEAGGHERAVTMDRRRKKFPASRLGSFLRGVA